MATNFLLFLKKITRDIVLIGLILNAIWEFAQAGPLYDMWKEVSTAAGLFHISMAILGDAVIVLSIAAFAQWLCRLTSVLSLTWDVVICILVTAFFSALFLEWSAKFLDWRTYNELMPTLTVFGETVGLSPLHQITFLPFLSIFLAIKFNSPLVISVLKSARINNE